MNVGFFVVGSVLSRVPSNEPEYWVLVDTKVFAHILPAWVDARGELRIFGTSLLQVDSNVEATIGSKRALPISLEEGDALACTFLVSGLAWVPTAMLFEHGLGADIDALVSNTVSSSGKSGT